MKFVLHRNPENRNQKIPFPAMQVAGLADAKQLTIQADAGSSRIHRTRFHTALAAEGYRPHSAQRLHP